MIFGSPLGVYDAHAFVGVGGSSGTYWHWQGGSEIGNTTRFVYSSSLRGNDSPSRTGDARSLSEQLQMLGGLSTLGNDQTRFFGNIDGSGVVPGTSTMGNASISFVTPANWPDYNSGFNDTAATAYAVIRDGPLQSIGELGNIYDPFRIIATTNGSATPSILQARGGGRTLKIGQIDDIGASNGARFAGPSATTFGWFSSAWRLADVFGVAPVTQQVLAPTARGKLNINGVLRDNGVAFRAALRAYNFLASPGGDSQLSGLPLAPSEADQLITDIKTYLTANGPMMERGEISQLPFFNTGTAASKTMSTTSDRGREEIFRRTVEMITTRSASFTVYAVGEAVRQNADGTKVTTAQKRLATTFQLEPLVNGSPLSASVNPADAVTSYRVRRIYASH